MGSRKKEAGAKKLGAYRGDRIRGERERRDWSLMDLGTACKPPLYPSVLSDIERNEKDVYSDTLKRVADALELSFDYVFGLTDEPRRPTTAKKPARKRN